MKKFFLSLLACAPFLLCVYATSAKASQQIETYSDEVGEQLTPTPGSDFQAYSPPEEPVAVSQISAIDLSQAPEPPQNLSPVIPETENVTKEPANSGKDIDYSSGGVPLTVEETVADVNAPPAIDAAANSDGVDTTIAIIDGKPEEEVAVVIPPVLPVDPSEIAPINPVTPTPPTPTPIRPAPPQPAPPYIPPAPRGEFARYEQGGAQLPTEVVERARDTQVLAGIPQNVIEDAISRGDIVPERITTPEKDGEKLIYKIELEDISFICGENDETPATIAKIKGQDEQIVVLWDSDFFEKADYDAQTRCKQVSARFAEFAEKKLSITYMTNGKLNGQSVICLTDSEDGDCGEGIPLHKGLLFTLKPKDNPDNKLKQLASLFQAKLASKSDEALKVEEKTPDSKEKSNDEKKPLKE